MSRTYRVYCLSEALSPITHMSGTSGNESIVSREPIIGESGKIKVPVLSGNSVRHRTVREPGARWLVEAYDLEQRLTLQQLNFLFHGGNRTEKGGIENLRLLVEAQRYFPLLRLLGSSLPEQIISGSLLVSSAMLICRENAPCITAQLPEGWTMPATPLYSSEEFVSAYQYTRQDAANTCLSISNVEDIVLDSPPSNMMIYSGQAIMRGAMFWHTYTLQHVADVELGALIWSLQLWQEHGGTIGGMGGKGHGRLKTWVYCESDIDAAVNAYVDHARSVREEAVDWLTRAFSPKVKKSKRGKADTEANTSTSAEVGG